MIKSLGLEAYNRHNLDRVIDYCEVHNAHKEDDLNRKLYDLTLFKT